MVLSGDPLSVYTTVEQTWVEGRLIYDRSNPEHRRYAVGGHNVYRTTAEEEEAAPAPAGGRRAVNGGRRPRVRATLLVLALAAALMAAFAPAAAGQVAVRAEMLHTVSGAALENAVVIAGADGAIEWVGPAADAEIPPGVEVLEAAVVTPGLVDAHSVVGLAGALNSNVGQVRDQDQLDRSSPIQPELRAIDAYDATDTLVEWVRSYGVTTLHTGHGPGALISGQTMIVKTRGRNTEEAVVVPARMLAATLGNAVSANFDSPGTSSKGVAMLRGALIGAQAYQEQVRRAAAGGSDDPQPPAPDLAKEALGPGARRRAVAARHRQYRHRDRYGAPVAARVRL